MKQLFISLFFFALGASIAQAETISCQGEAAGTAKGKGMREFTLTKNVGSDTYSLRLTGVVSYQGNFVALEGVLAKNLKCVIALENSTLDCSQNEPLPSDELEAVDGNVHQNFALVGKDIDALDAQGKPVKVKQFYASYTRGDGFNAVPFHIKASFIKGQDKSGDVNLEYDEGRYNFPLLNATCKKQDTGTAQAEVGGNDPHVNQSSKAKAGSVSPVGALDVPTPLLKKAE